MNKVEKCCGEIGVKFDQNEIDRGHHVSKSVFDTDAKQRVRSIIVKFKSWESRIFFYKTHSKKFM